MASEQPEVVGKHQAEPDDQPLHPSGGSTSFNSMPELMLSGPDGADEQLTSASFDRPESGVDLISRSPSPTAASEASQAPVVDDSTSGPTGVAVQPRASGDGGGLGTQPQYPTIEGSFKASEHLPG